MKRKILMLMAILAFIIIFAGCNEKSSFEIPSELMERLFENSASIDDPSLIVGSWIEVGKKEGEAQTVEFYDDGDFVNVLPEGFTLSGTYYISDGKLSVFSMDLGMTAVSYKVSKNRLIITDGKTTITFERQ